MTPHRFEYAFELENLRRSTTPDSFAEGIWRNPTIADQQILAELMLDSYRGTIDYDGETIDDAIREVDSYFSHQDSGWFDYSWLAFIENDLVCASLVGFWKDRNSPIIAYVMTASQHKGKHLATIGVSRSLESLAEKNYTKVYAVITEGNVPSEWVFTRLGFRRFVPTK
jgi:RimJ/RimL family protein N-acetyltransferase